MSSSSSPCAACKFLRRKCTQECVFAPYFPADQPQRFANVHKVFGASNVAKILNELPAEHREDAVNSLAYEAEARLRDPVYGCVGLISILQHNLKELQLNLEDAKKELATLVGPSAMMQMLQDPYIQAQFHPDFAAAAAAAAASSNPGVPLNMAQMMGLMPAGDPGPGPGPGPLVIADHVQQLQPQAQQQHIGGHQLIIRDVAQQHQPPLQHQHQHQQQSLIIRDANLQAQQQHAIDAHQHLASVMTREEQEMMRNFEQQQRHHIQQQQQQQLMRFGGASYHEAGGSSSVSADFIQMGAPTNAMEPMLALGGGFDGTSYHMQQQQQQQLEPQPLLLLQQPLQSDVEAVQTIEHHQPLQIEQLFNEQPGSINEQGEAAV